MKKVLLFLIGVFLMARGHPDYQALSTQTVRVEQGSVNANVYETGFSRIDGGGRVIWYDDFRAGAMRYLLDNDAGGVDPALDFTEGHMYGFSPTLKIDPVGSGGLSGIRTYFDMPLSGKVGFEIGLYMALNHGRLQSNFAFASAAGSNYFFGLQILEGLNTFRVSIGSGWQLVHTPNIASNLVNRHIAVKIVFDPTAGAYDTLMIGTGFVDISQYSAPSGFTQEGGATYFDFYNAGQSGAQNEAVWLNYIVLTADEP